MIHETRGRCRVFWSHMRSTLSALTLYAALAAVVTGCATGTGAIYDIPSPESDVAAWTARLEARMAEEVVGPELLGTLALARMHQGRIAEAERLASRAISHSACDPIALAISARIALARDVPEVAVRRYDDASRCAQGSLGARARRGRIRAHIVLAEKRLAEGGIVDVLALIERAHHWTAGLDSDQERVLGRIADAAAEVALRQGAQESAARALRVAEATVDEDEHADRREGQLLYLQGETEQGGETLEQWAETSSERWARLGRFYRDIGDREAELKAWRRATESKEATPEVWHARAAIALAVGQPVEASEAYEHLALLAHAPVKRAEALLDAAQRFPDEHSDHSERLVRRAVEIAPTHWPSVSALASGLLHNGRRPEGLAVLSYYVAHAVDRRTALGKSASLLERLGFGTEAIRLLEGEVAGQKAPPGLELELVQLLHQRRSNWARRNEVLAAYESKNVDNVEASIEVARLWIRYRQSSRAKPIAERLRAEHPERFEGGLLLADVYRAIGRPNSETSVISQTVARAAEPQRAALAVGMRYLEWREHARAVRWLETALVGALPKSIERKVHRGLLDAFLGQHPPARREAARHMRRWLALTPEAEKVEAVEFLLQRVAGVTALSELRIELLRALVARHPDDAEALEALAQVLLDAERWKEAADIYGAAIAHTQSSREMTVRAGRAFVSTGQHGKALDFFERLHLLPTELDVRTWRILGEHLHITSNATRGDAYFAKLLERTESGGHLTELNIFTKTALQLGSWERALQAARQLLEHRPDHRDAMTVMGEALTRLARHGEATTWFERAIHAAPRGQQVKVRKVIGDRLLAMGRLKQAAALFEVALSEPSVRLSSVLFEKLMTTRRRMGDHEGAVRAARLYVSRAASPRSAGRGALTAARALEQSGLYDQAGELLSTALANARSDKSLLEASAANALDRGELELAGTLYRRLGQQRGGAGRAWKEISQKLANAGHAEVAVSVLTAAAEQANAPVTLHTELGRRLLELGRMDQANAAFQRAVTQAVSLTDVSKVVDEAYRAVGQLRRLEKFYVRLVAAVPSRTEPPLTLGKLRLELGDRVGAAQAFARYLAASPRGHLAVAEAYAQYGSIAEALAHYRRAWEQPAPGGSPLPLQKLAAWLSACGHSDALEWFVNLHVRRAQEPGVAAREASEAFTAVGNLTQALRWLREADALKPDVRNAFVLGELLLATGDTEGARRAWAQAVERRRTRGGMTRIGRKKSSRTMAEAAVEVSERWVQARRLDEAIRTVREAVAKYGDAPLLAVTEARYLVRHGDVSAGIERARNAASMFKQAPIGAVQALVAALRDHDRDAELADLLAKANASDWSHELGLRQLSLLGRLERWQEAVQLAGELTRSGKPERNLSVGLEAFQGGLFELAVRHLERALRHGLDEPLVAIRVLDAIKVIRPGLIDDSGENTVESAVAAGDRIGELVLSAQRLADERDLEGALASALGALRLAPDDLSIFHIGLSLAVLAGSGPGLEDVLETLRSRQHPKVTVLKVAVKRLAASLRPNMARRLQSSLIALQPGVAEHHLVAVGLALQAGDDVAARWHTDALLAIAGSESRVLLELAERWQRWTRSDAAEALLARLDDADGVIAVEREMIRLRAALLAGDATRAEAVVSKILAVGEDDPRLRLRAASMALELGVLPELARTWMEPILTRGHWTDHSLSLGARAAWRTGDNEQARTYLEALLALHHVDGDVWGGLLGALVAVADIESLNRLADHLPLRAAWPEPELAVVGMVASALEYQAPRMSTEQKEAVADAVDRLATRAAKRAPTASSQLASAVAVSAEVHGDEDRALAAYEAPLIADPHSPVHANNLAYVLSRFGRELERALELVVQAQLRTAESVMSYMDTEAWVRHRMGDNETARRLMALAIHGAHERESRSPAGQVEMLYHYAMTLDAVGQHDRAWAVWRDCARRDWLSPYGARCKERFDALGQRRGEPLR